MPPLTLESLSAIAERSVTLRGQSVTLRGLSSSEVIKLQERMPPRPTAHRDHEHLPEIRHATARWEGRFRAAIVGLGLGLTNHAGEPYSTDRPDEWVKSWVDDVQSALTEEEIYRLWTAQSAIESFGCNVDEVLGSDTRSGLFFGPAPALEYDTASITGFRPPSGEHTQTDLYLLLEAAAMFGRRPGEAIKDWALWEQKVAVWFTKQKRAEELELRTKLAGVVSGSGAFGGE